MKWEPEVKFYTLTKVYDNLQITGILSDQDFVDGLHSIPEYGSDQDENEHLVVFCFFYKK